MQQWTPPSGRNTKEDVEEPICWQKGVRVRLAQWTIVERSSARSSARLTMALKQLVARWITDRVATRNCSVSCHMDARRQPARRKLIGLARLAGSSILTSMKKVRHPTCAISKSVLHLPCLRPGDSEPKLSCAQPRKKPKKGWDTISEQHAILK
jgi:hypothetical protein